MSDADAFGLFHCYRRGWRDGASGRMPEQIHVGHRKGPYVKEYMRGHDDGRKAMNRQLQRACKRLGYVPNPLRSDHE